MLLKYVLDVFKGVLFWEILRLILFATTFLCRKFWHALKMKIIINYKASSIIIKKLWMLWLGIVFIYQGFIQVILMSIRQHKKLNLHKILFWSFLALKLRWKYFFYFKLFICPPDVKRPTSFRGYIPWTPARVYSTLGASSAFYNIQKLNLTSKRDISKTAWITHIYIYIYIYIQKLKIQNLDVLEWILNKTTHFQSSQIFWLFYITFYSVCE